MTELIKNLTALVKVKTLITLTVIGVWAILALRGIVNAESVMYVVTAVVSFYFGTQHEKLGKN